VKKGIFLKYKDKSQPAMLIKYKCENRRLKMGNTLFRDFLQLIGRRVKPNAKYPAIYRHRDRCPVSRICALRIQYNIINIKTP